METTVAIIFSTLGFYLLVGLIFYFPFVFNGMKKIDEGAKDTPLGFKILILPATLVFWPVLLKKWISSLSSQTPK